MANPNSRDLKAVAKALADPVAAAALDRLVECGCDRDEVRRLLARLHHADAAGKREAKTFKRLARTLEQASSGVADLPQWREVGALGLPDDPAVWLSDCSHDLKLLADAIRARLSTSDSRSDDVRIHRAKRRLVQFVLQWSGQPQDADTASLIAAVLRSDVYTVDAHISWRETDWTTIDPGSQKA